MASLVLDFFPPHIQRFFKYLCIASKVDKAIELAKTAIKDGKVGLHPVNSVCVCVFVINRSK